MNVAFAKQVFSTALIFSFFRQCNRGRPKGTSPYAIFIGSERRLNLKNVLNLTVVYYVSSFVLVTTVLEVDVSPDVQYSRRRFIEKTGNFWKPCFRSRWVIITLNLAHFNWSINVAILKTLFFLAEVLKPYGPSEIGPIRTTEGTHRVGSLKYLT